MIKNKWKTVLSQKGMTQAEAAETAGVSKPFFSGVVNGLSVLQMSELDKICSMLHISVWDIYPADVVKAVYGIESGKSKDNSATVSFKLRGNAAKRFTESKVSFGFTANCDFVAHLLTIVENMKGA